VDPPHPLQLSTQGEGHGLPFGPAPSQVGTVNSAPPLLIVRPSLLLHRGVRGHPPNGAVSEASQPGEGGVRNMEGRGLLEFIQ